MMMDASMALGVYLNNGVISSRVSKTTKDITMFDTAVLHPAIQFTADRENDPATTTTTDKQTRDLV